MTRLHWGPKESGLIKYVVFEPIGEERVVAIDDYGPPMEVAIDDSE